MDATAKAHMAAWIGTAIASHKAPWRMTAANGTVQNIYPAMRPQRSYSKRTWLSRKNTETAAPSE